MSSPCGPKRNSLKQDELDQAPKPRVCHLKKTYPEQEYGFDLHAEKLRGQFIGNVDAESPAGLAGLRKGDRILAVNGVSVPQENHKEVVKRIKEDPLQCHFVVIDESGFLWYSSRKMSVPIADVLSATTLGDISGQATDATDGAAQAAPNNCDKISSPQNSVKSLGDKSAPKSPICCSNNQSPAVADHCTDAAAAVDDEKASSFVNEQPVVQILTYQSEKGLLLNDETLVTNTSSSSTANNSITVKDDDDHVINDQGQTQKSPQQNGIAEAQQADHDTNTTTKNHPAQNGSVVTTQQQNGSLVKTTCSPQSPIKSSKEQHADLTEDNGDFNSSTNSLGQPRLCKLRKAYQDQEYGFNLHFEKNRGHFVGKVDPGSPAFLAGMVQGYRIVGVNSTLIYAKSPHKEVVSLIKQSQLNTDLLIVSAEMDAEYAKKETPFSFSRAEVFVGDDFVADSAAATAAPTSPHVVFEENDDNDDDESFSTPSSPRISSLSATNNNNNSSSGSRQQETSGVVGGEEKSSPIVAADRHAEENRNRRDAPIGSMDNTFSNNVSREEQKANGSSVRAADYDNNVSTFEKSSDENTNAKTGNSLANNNSSSNDYNNANSNTNEKKLDEIIHLNPVQEMFRMSASEMRQHLSRNKKVDPRKESISIREKYEIVQNL